MLFIGIRGFSPLHILRSTVYSVLPIKDRLLLYKAVNIMTWMGNIDQQVRIMTTIYTRVIATIHREHALLRNIVIGYKVSLYLILELLLNVLNFQLPHFEA